MTTDQAFEEMVERLVQRSGKGEGINGTLCLGTVKEVDEREGTCVVERDDGPDLYDVRLNAVIDEAIKDRVMVVPAVGSYVWVMSLRELTDGLIVATSKIARVRMQTGDITMDLSAEGILINGGQSGGLIDIHKLTEKVNELVDAFNAHTHTIAAGGISTQGSATAQTSATPVTVPAVTARAQKLDAGYYEDERVKH